MSKLTNCQIRSMIYGLKQMSRSAAARGDMRAFRRRQKLIEKCQAELADREDASLDPGSEIQTVRHGEA